MTSEAKPKRLRRRLNSVLRVERVPDSPLPPPPDYTEVIEDGQITIEPAQAGIRGKPHVPTPYTRRQVELLVCYGLQQEAIAHIVGVALPTLQSHYVQELKHGKEKVVAMVAHRLLDCALRGEGTDAIRAAQFILKTRGGWSESVGHLQVQHEGRVQHEHYALSHEERAARMLQVLNASTAGGTGQAVAERIRAMVAAARPADGSVPFDS